VLVRNSVTIIALVNPVISVAEVANRTKPYDPFISVMLLTPETTASEKVIASW